MVRFGFLCRKEKWLDREAVKKSMSSHISKGIEDIDMKAFEEGLKCTV
jgi:Pyruvate/2-oxoacid:ferredoxin oxidoreductase gamma subunit